MTERIDKVNSLLEHELPRIVRKEVVFPANVLVTVTRVEAAGNLFEAKAYVSSYPEDRAEEALALLKKNVFSIQQELNRALKMRPVPKIIFVKDEITQKADRVEEILHKLKEAEK